MNFDFDNNNNIDLDLNLNNNLELQWKEIEEKQLNRKKNIQFNKSDININSNLENKFPILQIDLKKLIHAKDNEFENFVISKIKDLELLKSLKNKNQNKTKKIGNTINIINNSSKTFLKEKKEEVINQNKKITIDDLINDDNQKTKVKQTMNTIFTMINEGNELNIEDIQNNNNNNNNISNSNKNDLFIKDESKSFLKKEEEKKKERKKKAINNKNNNEEKKSGKKMGILNKIDENYKYLYKLYPNMKNKK